MSRGLPRLPDPKFDFLPFGGGLDTETPRFNVNPSMLRNSQNFEVAINGGYQDLTGYERFNGNSKPSDALYTILNVTITGSFSAGDTVTGATTGATAVIVLVDTSAAQDFLVVTKTVGVFNSSEDLEVSAVVEGNMDASPAPSGATTAILHAQYTNLAADNYRADIAAVTGSGSILGVWMLNDIVYAFRNNAGATAADLYKSTSSGWSQVSLGRELSFTSGGTYEILEGDTITGATSGATAVVTRVMFESGSFGSGTAAGRLIFASQTGTFQSENLDVGANANVATIAADSSAITLSPGGRFEFITYNFGGQSGTKRMYGCDGVNRGFEFDGTVFAPIDTTSSTDTPTHVAAHKNHLFFSFESSVQHSGIGTPYIWSPVFGAAEIATGDIVTGFMSEPGVQGGGTLGIYNRNTLHMLYGDDSDNWNLVRFRDEIGAFEHSIQQIGLTVFLDDRGITNLSTVQAHGNFQHATLSRHVQREINQKKSLTRASCISRDKNQYRIFFTDRSGLYVTMEGNTILGIMPVVFEHKVECVFSLEDTNGDEVIMFGSDDGFVYQMEKGTSFDGEDIDAYMFLHYHYNGLLRWNKKYLGVTIEVEGSGYSEFDFSYELGYGASSIPQPLPETKNLDLSTVSWDEFIWDNFIWDGVTLSPSNNKLTGSAENISLIIRKKSDYFQTIKLSGALIRFIPRRKLRE